MQVSHEHARFADHWGRALMERFGGDSYTVEALPDPHEETARAFGTVPAFRIRVFRSLERVATYLIPWRYLYNDQIDLIDEAVNEQ